MINETVTVKAIASGGLGVLFAVAFADVETVALFLTGLIASSLSYFYDWVHSHPRSKGLKMVSEAFKYVFYGVSVAFITYYTCINHCSQYIDLPKIAWGSITALCAGSAVVIIKWFGDIANRFMLKKVS